MNVLVLLNYFDRDGGTSKTFTEGKYLAALGVRLVVVVPRNPFAKSDVAAKLQAQGLKYFSAATHFRVLYFLFPYTLWKISRIIRREKIDLLHVNHGKALVLGAVLSRLRRIPLVYTINGVTPRELPGSLKNYWFRRVSRVIAVSEESAAHFLRRVRFPAERVVICRNAIDFAHFQGAVKGAQETAGGLRLLYLSRLDRDKRRAVDAVMEAAALAFPARPQLRLRILGDGRQMGRIRKKARAINAALGRDVITIEGWVDDPLASFAAADVVLGVGRCVLEAIAAGRPVLVVGNERIGGWVTQANFLDLQKENFSGRGARTAVSGENLAGQFLKIPGETAGLEKIRALARRDHDAARLSPLLEKIFRQAASLPSGTGPNPLQPPGGNRRTIPARIAGALGRGAEAIVFRRSKWRVLCDRERIFLYAGNVPDSGHYDRFTGLSLWKSDSRHIRHDIRRRHLLPDDSVDVYQAEDVLEHIAFTKLPAIINDIHRILKPGGIFRLSLPDYRCDVLRERSRKNEAGEIMFDPGGGGSFTGRRVRGAGHLWFPRFETVRELLQGSCFRDCWTFYHYYDEKGNAVLQPIDYGVGYVKRTPDHDPRVGNPFRPMSIVVDAVKRG